MMSVLNYRAAFVEFLGTLVFALTIEISTVSGIPDAPFVIGIALFIEVYAFGKVSGGHFNPAVSLGIHLASTNTLGLANLLLYTLGQLLGAFFGALIGCGLQNGSFVFLPNKHGIAVVFVIEVIFSAVLCHTVMVVALDHRTDTLGSLAIGCVVYTGAAASGKISQGCFNPSVALAVFASHATRNSEFVAADFFLYFLSPFVGSLLAVCIFRITRPYLYADVPLLAGGKEKTHLLLSLLPPYQTSEASSTHPSAAATAKATGESF